MRKCALIAIGIVIFLGIASASFKYNSHSLIGNYKEGEIIKGKVNMTFVNENADSVVKSNFIGNISLLKLLEESGLKEGIDFDCSTKDCEKEYSAGNVVNTMNILGDRVIGLKVSGNDITEISSIRFDVVSDVSTSCSRQLTIDVLDDEKNILMNKKHTTNACSSKSYGCFDPNLGNYQEAIISESDYYCENITLDAGPAYKLGARIKNSTTGKGELKMELYKIGEGFIEECVLPGHTQQVEDLECVVEYSSLVKDNYLVCLIADKTGVDYKIRTETNNACGTDNLGETFSRDYEIFARPMEFDRINMQINDSLLEDEYIYGYIEENYIGVCKPYCVIPIKLSGISQELSFDNVKIEFKDGNTLVSDSSLYELEIEPILINAKSVELNLEAANFIVPFDTQEKRFKLYLNDKIIFQANVNISESFDFDIAPRFVTFGLNTEFKVVSSGNINSSTWNFGDGTIKTVSGGSVVYKYLEQKEFELEVKVLRNDGIEAIKKFKVVVGNPKESVNITLKEYNDRLEKINSEINAFGEWAGKEIRDEINFASLSSILKKLENDFKNSSSDAQYSAIMEELIKLNVPYSISISSKGELPMAIGYNNIDVKYVEELSKREVSDSEELIGQIINWVIENYNPIVEFETISAFGDRGGDELLSKFKIKLNSNADAEKGYLFIDYPTESIVFIRSYSQVEIGGSGTYIPVDGNTREIEFLIKDSINVEELGAYISPEITRLAIDEKEICLPGDSRCETQYPWKLVIIWLSVIFVFVLIIYIILYSWYKKHYENYLFRNKNDLYNLIYFIYNSRVAGLGDGEIRSRLREKKWKGEQITYAFRKIDGKRTGMFEIPLLKMFENKKVRKEIEKRQGFPLDARFIKRPGIAEI